MRFNAASSSVVCPGSTCTVARFDRPHADYGHTSALYETAKHWKSVSSTKPSREISAGQPAGIALSAQSRMLYDNMDTMISVNSLGGLLLKQGKNRDALDVMAPGELPAHTALAGTARLHRFLLNLGNARARVGEFASAEKTLIDAQALSEKMRGANHKDTKACDQGLVEMYEAWEKSEPGKGIGAKAGGVEGEGGVSGWAARKIGVW